MRNIADLESQINAITLEAQSDKQVPFFIYFAYVFFCSFAFFRTPKKTFNFCTNVHLPILVIFHHSAFTIRLSILTLLCFLCPFGFIFAHNTWSGSVLKHVAVWVVCSTLRQTPHPLSSLPCSFER
jgi:hypothetical protein